MNRVINFLLSIIYVPKCVVCRKSLSPNESLYLCERCHQKLYEPFLNECRKCGRPISGRGPDDLCASCRFVRYRFDRLFGAGLYEGLLRRSLVHYKFYQKTSYSKTYAAMIAERFSALGLTKPSVITYVPLHPRRLFWRGFHQTELIARFLGEAMELPVLPLLKKVKNTKPQRKLRAKDRRKNVRKSFEALLENPIKGQHILLIDDIATTNSTADECARILKENGAKTVTVGVVAVSVPKNY